MSEYGVKAADFSDRIYAGKLNTAGNAFTDKQELTAQVLLAVAEWTDRNFHGDVWVNVGGYRLDIKVTPLPVEADAA